MCGTEDRRDAFPIVKPPTDRRARTEAGMRPIKQACTTPWVTMGIANALLHQVLRCVTGVCSVAGWEEHEGGPFVAINFHVPSVVLPKPKASS